MKNIFKIIIAAIILSSKIAIANDIKGGKDHSIIGRYTSSVMSDYGELPYAEAEIPLEEIKYDSNNNIISKKLDMKGKILHYSYNAPKDASAIEVIRNYESALKQKGFKVLYICAQAEKCQNMRLYHYTDKWTGNNSYFKSGYSAYLEGGGHYPLTFLVARRTDNQGDISVVVSTSEEKNKENLGGKYYLQVIEAKSMQKDKVEILNAKDIGSKLTQAGKVAFHGVYFETGSATIQTRSQKQINEMAALLKSQANISVFIVGHTDNVGDYLFNQNLSAKRAASLVQALVNLGIDKKRLQPVGVANVSPMASNLNEAGRAQNRRVEMVLK